MDYKLPTKEDLRQVPMNKTAEAIIIDVQIKTWLEILGSDKLLAEQEKGNFLDTPEKPLLPQIVIKFEAEKFPFESKMAYFEKPSTASALGRFILRYDESPKVGQKIMVDFDKDGKYKILTSN